MPVAQHSTGTFMCNLTVHRKRDITGGKEKSSSETKWNPGHH